MRIRWLSAFFACALAALASSAVGAQAPAPKPPANDDCLTCHSDPAAARADGSTVAVAPEIFGISVHGAGGLACVDCHADLATATEFPHAEQLQPAQCATCHEAPVSQYAASAHARARAGGDSKAATCADCHGAHDIRPASDPQSKTNHFNVPATCGACHGPKGQGTGAPSVQAHFDDSIHGKALTQAGLVVAPNCASCHGAHEVRGKADAASKVHRGNVVATCTACHQGIGPVYARSIHAQAVQSGNALAPVCADCHTAHDIGRVTSDAWQLGIIRECGTCHEQSLRTYRDTFHGKVSELGFTRVAKCADCHGAHDVLPASNPASMISPQRRLATCQQCHPGANQNFAAYDPHADPHDTTRNPVLAYSSMFMKYLLAGTFLFFGIHTLLWFPRSWQVRRQRNARHMAARHGGGGPAPGEES